MKKRKQTCLFGLRFCGTPCGNRTHNQPLGGACYIHLTKRAKFAVKARKRRLFFEKILLLCRGSIAKTDIAHSVQNFSFEKSLLQKVSGKTTWLYCKWYYTAKLLCRQTMSSIFTYGLLRPTCFSSITVRKQRFRSNCVQIVQQFVPHCRKSCCSANFTFQTDLCHYRNAVYTGRTVQSAIACVLKILIRCAVFATLCTIWSNTITQTTVLLPRHSHFQVLRCKTFKSSTGNLFCRFLPSCRTKVDAVPILPVKTALFHGRTSATIQNACNLVFNCLLLHI